MMFAKKWASNEAHNTIEQKCEGGAEKLDSDMAQRVANRMRELEGNPRPQGCKKLKGHENQYRIRVGDYRMIYSIEDDKLIVLVIRIAHRKRAYE